MTHSVRHWWPEVALFAFAAVLIFARLPLPLLEPEEGRYAEIPRQMLLGGHVVTPVYQGQPYLDKPPLLYWAVMASYRLFGVHDWSARLVPAAAAWLTVLVVYGWGRAVAGRRVGLTAAAVLTLSADFIYRGPMLTMNGPLALFVTASLAAAHVSLCGGGRWWWVASAVCCALGVLMKGPVAVVLVGAPLLALRWLDPAARRPRLLDWAGYAGVVTLIAGPWFVAESIAEPTFVEYFFFKHHLTRYVEPFDHAEPAWFYLPQAALACLPWALLLIPTLFRRPAGPRPAVVKLAAVAAGWALLFFSLSGSKRAVYLVPLMPLLAVAFGGLIAWGWAGATATTRRVTGGAFGLTAAAVAAGVLAWLPRYSEQFSVEEVARRVRADEPTVRLVCYGHQWDSLGVYTGGKLPLQIETPEEMAGELAGRERAVVLVHTAARRDELVRSLPPGWAWTPVAESKVAFAGLVRRE